MIVIAVPNIFFSSICRNKAYHCFFFLGNPFEQKCFENQSRSDGNSRKTGFQRHGESVQNVFFALHLKSFVSRSFKKSKL
jgi:hypothetical protein